jgi:hypothetical protein
MARCVDEVDDLWLDSRRTLILGRPPEADGSRLYGDLPLRLQFKEVSCGVAVVDI